MSAENSILLEGIVKREDSFTLGPIDLAIPAGHITAVVGPNGSGKSTLFHILMNLKQPDAGSFEVLGRTGRGDNAEIQDRVGYMPDVYDMLDESMTPQKMIDYISPFYTNWDMDAYKRLMQKFKVDERKKFRKMSRGMIQKFSFVQTLSQKPEVLLLDEPSTGLDPLAWRDMMDEIHRYMEDGRHTVVISTHIIEEVRRLADYVVFLYDGRILGQYEKDRLLTGWKEIWIEGSLPSDNIHIRGIYYVDDDERHQGRLIADDAATALEALEKSGITVYRTKQIHLDEIMQYLILSADKGRDILK